MILASLSWSCAPPGWSSLPVYSLEQTDSARAGYRRTTLTSAGAIFVHDFEEYALRLVNSDPTQAVGRYGFGMGKICAIEGQNPAAYLAADMGSEMPAYEVFRAERQPPFDWRHATFRRMRLDTPYGPTANKETTDPSVIREVVLALGEGEPAPAFTVETDVTASTVHSISLWSDELPGLIFAPQVYLAPTGEVFLAESFEAVAFQGTKETIRARWIPASPALTKWATTAD